jgi:hypothetical protein
MGSQGGDGPNGLRQRQVSTLFLRVPSIDWPAVRIGVKTEFRTMPRAGSRIVLNRNYPTPVVAYATSNGPLRELAHRLMVLEAHRFEPLFAIAEDAEALRREQQPSYDHFRRYWRMRQKGVYRPMQQVHVWRVRPFRLEDDLEQFGVQLLHRLYGDYLKSL